MFFKNFKSLFLALAMLLVIGLTGCGDNANTEQSGNANENSVVSAENGTNEAEIEEVDEEEILRYHAVAYFNRLQEGNFMLKADALKEELGDVFVLDIRDSDTYSAGHIPGATNIPMSDVGLQIDELPDNEKIIVVCYSGQTASQTSGVLRMAGFDTHILTGGFGSWEAAGFDIE